MAIKTTSETVSKQAILDKVSTELKNKDDKSAKATIFEMAEEIKEKTGDCSIMENIANDLEEAIARKKDELEQIRAEGHELAHVYTERFDEFRIADYALKDFKMGDENYKAAEERRDEAYHTMCTSRGKVVQNNNNDYSKSMDIFMDVFDLGKIKRLISFFKLAAQKIWSH